MDVDVANVVDVANINDVGNFVKVGGVVGDADGAVAMEVDAVRDGGTGASGTMVGKDSAPDTMLAMVELQLLKKRERRSVRISKEGLFV